MWRITWLQRAVRSGRSLGTALFACAITILAGAGPASWADDLSAMAISGPLPTDAVAVVAATTAAGRTPTEFGVSHSGAATYRIPLWTPPGIGAVELDLALVYNSRGGNGVLGTGWSLAGLSSISRCNRTLAQDGSAGGVDQHRGRSFLPGWPTSSSWSAAATAWPGRCTRPKSNRSRAIVANGTPATAPPRSPSRRKNGLVYEYGATADARVHAALPPTVRTWALARIRDRAGRAPATASTLAYSNEAQYGRLHQRHLSSRIDQLPDDGHGGRAPFTASLQLFRTAGERRTDRTTWRATGCANRTNSIRSRCRP